MGDEDRSIDELLPRLEAEDDGQFVYRGQRQDYGMVLPSNLRGAIKSADGAAIQLDRRVLAAQRTVRAAEQARFRQGIVKTFGSGVGHVLAQQYGLGSDVIDVSSSPRIAAFFATHEWPTCRPIADGLGVPGVIYRWRKPEETRTPIELKADTLLASVTPVDVEEATPARAIVAFPEDGTAEYLLARDAQDAWAIFPTMVFTYQEILAAMEDHIEQARGDYVIGWAFEGLPASRWAAQAGGFLRPEIVYRAYLGSPPDGGFQVIDDPNLDEARLNRTVLGGMPAAVTDAGRIGPPDSFRFRHSPSRIEISPEQLWPPPDRDLLFRYLASLAWVRHHAYFDEMRANYPWERITGLLDRGFYPENEDDAHNRTEGDAFRRLLAPGSLKDPRELGAPM